MSDALMTPAEVAEWLNVDRAWVYAHAAELDAKRIGNGPKARLRFDRDYVEAYLNGCSTGRESAPVKTAAKPAVRRRHSTAALGTNVVLLPIRGRSTPENAAQAA